MLSIEGRIEMAPDVSSLLSTPSNSMSAASPEQCCDDDAAPVFLQSKIDDDDGDGNPFDEDFPTINDEDDDIADHAWIRDIYGVYHLFFQTEDHGQGSYIEHYTSTTLRALDYVGVALRADPDGWDSHGLWAPYVVKSGGIYYMFYTGTDGPAGDPRTVQRIGLATSPDLMTWKRAPINDCPGTAGVGCVYECNESWTTWGGPPGRRSSTGSSSKKRSSTSWKSNPSGIKWWACCPMACRNG
jgi:hypothetical protein